MSGHRRIDAYLRDLDAQLHLPPAQRRRVLEEATDHLLCALERTATPPAACGSPGAAPWSPLRRRSPPWQPPRPMQEARR